LNTYRDDELYHIGVAGRSGRYPLGSGKRPFQGSLGYRMLDGISSHSEKEYKSGKKIADESGKIFDKISNTIPKRFTEPRQMKFDLSNLTDEDLKGLTSRFELEKKYTTFMNERNPQRRRGAETAKEILSYAGAVAGLTSSALGIALAIKELQS
jgi:hypothetical protein